MIKADLAHPSPENADTPFNVGEIVTRMDDETFIRFAKELQYSKKHYEIGNRIAQENIRFSDGEHLSKVTMDIYATYGNLMEEVVKSSIYDAVRLGVFPRFGAKKEGDWTGWVGVRENDARQIEIAIETKMRAKMPIVGSIGRKAITLEQLETADQVIKSHGIEQVFVLDPGKNLLTTFKERFTS